jgi:N-acetylmuramoyl-L-alanine amidase
LIFLVLIYLDGGHGGRDGGAAANGIREKDIVLKICKKIQAGLAHYEDVEVLMSREDDIYLTLNERTIKANQANADVLISVHCNAATAKTAKGFESYVYVNAPSATVAFQNVMHQEIIRAIGTNIDDRGKKSQNLHMVRESKMKAILTENLFVSNPSDSDKLKSDAFLDRLAQGHINGLEKFLGLRRLERPPKPEPTGKLYTVQVGAFEEKENAEALESDLRKIGYKPFIKYE